MRYILYLFTLGLVFTAGMLVGNFYLPARNASVAAAVSVPDMNRANPALDQANAGQTQHNLNALTQALSACPVVVEAERERLLNQIMLFLSVQDFELKKAIYEAEIAKNAIDSPTTSQFSRAAQDYTSAKDKAEQLADRLFPLEAAPQPSADLSTAPIADPALTGDPSTAAAPAAPPAEPSDQKAPAQKAEAVDKAK